LAGIGWWNGNGDFRKHLAKIFQPHPKLIPRCVVDPFSQTMILHHILDSQVFVGDNIVGCDDAPCKFYCMVFTLPTYLEMAFTQNLSGFSTIIGTFYFARNTPLASLKNLFSLTKNLGFSVAVPSESV
jgi:hypothetical protein